MLTSITKNSSKSSSQTCLDQEISQGTLFTLVESLNNETILFDLPRGETYSEESVLWQNVHGLSAVDHDSSHLLFTDNAGDKQCPIVFGQVGVFFLVEERYDDEAHYPIRGTYFVLIFFWIRQGMDQRLPQLSWHL